MTPDEYTGKHRDNSNDGESLGALRDGISKFSDPTCTCGCGHIGKHRPERAA